MKSSLKLFLKKKWHDVYYKFSGPQGVIFALKCQEATAHIDLNERPKKFLDWIRFKLHLSICKLCSDYETTSKNIRGLAQEASANQKNLHSADLHQLNDHLLKKFSS